MNGTDIEKLLNTRCRYVTDENICWAKLTDESGLCDTHQSKLKSSRAILTSFALKTIKKILVKFSSNLDHTDKRAVIKKFFDTSIDYFWLLIDYADLTIHPNSSEFKNTLLNKLDEFQITEDIMEQNATTHFYRILTDNDIENYKKQIAPELYDKDYKNFANAFEYYKYKLSSNILSSLSWENAIVDDTDNYYVGNKLLIL